VVPSAVQIKSSRNSWISACNCVVQHSNWECCRTAAENAIYFNTLNANTINPDVECIDYDTNLKRRPKNLGVAQHNGVTCLKCKTPHSDHPIVRKCGHLADEIIPGGLQSCPLMPLQ
jgi:hypothetical protein